MAALAELLPIEGAASAASDLATVLSPSQVQCFCDCAAKWYFKYGLKLPEPKTSNLALGIAVHEAIAANYTIKQETGCDLPIEDCLIEFDAAWATAELETEFRDEENPSEIAASGRRMVELYLRELAPKIQAQAIELPVEGVIGGVRVQGKVDLIDQAGELHDTKTASKKTTSVSATQAFQLATYAQLSPIPTTKVHIDVLVKTKTPQLIQITRTLTDQDFRATELQYPLIQEAMRAGLYVPNRSSMLCSRKNCPYWRVCEQEYGGTVAGAEES